MSGSLGIRQSFGNVVRERLLHSIAELLRLGLWDRGGMMMNHEPAATLLHKDIGGLHVGAKEVFVKRGRDVFIANHPGIISRQVNLGVADTDLQSALAAEDR